MKDLRFIHIKDNPDIDEDLRQKVNAFIAKGEAFNKDYELARTNETEYKKLKDKKDNSWRILNDDFLKFQNSRCPICEAIIGNFDDMEHFRPKDYYWWLAYDYKNYYAVCALCNSGYKKTEFPLLDAKKQVTFTTKDEIKHENPLLYNPTTDNPLELFELEFVSETDRKNRIFIKPLKSLEIDSYPYKKANTSIRIYNLNNTETNNLERQELIESLCFILIPLAKAKQELDENPTQINFVKYKQICKDIPEIGLVALIKKGNFKPFSQSRTLDL